MSADDFQMILCDGARYVVTRGSDSADSDPVPSATDPRFTDFMDALAYADSQPSEYGVRFAAGVLPPRRESWMDEFHTNSVVWVGVPGFGEWEMRAATIFRRRLDA